MDTKEAIWRHRNFQRPLEVLQQKKHLALKAYLPHSTPTQDRTTFDLKLGCRRVLSFPPKKILKANK